MIFGPTLLAEAEGAVLAHTHRTPGRVVKKGLGPGRRPPSPRCARPGWTR